MRTPNTKNQKAQVFFQKKIFRKSKMWKRMEKNGKEWKPPNPRRGRSDAPSPTF